MQYILNIHNKHVVKYIFVIYTYLALSALGFASPGPHTTLILHSFKELLLDADITCQAFVQGRNPHLGTLTF